jgi:hypothetical protein
VITDLLKGVGFIVVLVVASRVVIKARERSFGRHGPIRSRPAVVTAIQNVKAMFR